MATKLILVRHGQTDWNKESVFRGRSDIPLNMTGRREGIAIAFALEETSIAGICSSPLARARETVMELADRRAMDVSTVEELTDIDFGSWQGKSKDEIAKDFPDLYGTWTDHPELMQFPGGESLAAAAQRSVGAIRDLAVRHPDRPFVVCTHRVNCKAIVCGLLGASLSHFWQIKIDTGSITNLSLHGERWVLDHLNTDFHLAPLSDERITEDF